MKTKDEVRERGGGGGGGGVADVVDTMNEKVVPKISAAASRAIPTVQHCRIKAMTNQIDHGRDKQVYKPVVDDLIVFFG